MYRCTDVSNIYRVYIIVHYLYSMCIPTYSYNTKEIIVNNIFEVEIKIAFLRPLFSIQF